MAEFVKKTALGGYKPVAGGSSDSECTHVILTLGEYAGLKREISSAQQAAKMQNTMRIKKSTRYRAKRRAE